MMQQIHESFGDVDTFVRDKELPMATTRKLTDILNDQPMCLKF